jgi:glycosyltransferase involved in cell wall biosynthesis
MVRQLPGVLLTGTDRFGFPLDESVRKKFVMLSSIRPHYILGFSKGTGTIRSDEGVRFILLPALALSRVRQSMFLMLTLCASIYLALLRGVRIAISQSVFDALPLILAGKLLKLFGCKLKIGVQIQGDYEEVAILSHKLPGWSRPLLGQWAAFVLRNADAIRTVSDFTSNLVRSMVPMRTPCFVFPTFTDIDLFLDSSDEDDRPEYLLFAGALTRAKGFHLLMVAMDCLADRGIATRWVVAGEGDSIYQIETDLSQAHLNSDVEFVGFVPQVELRNLMRKCHALVMPSLSEGLPRVIIEAMACGKPVVASRTGGIPELVHDGRNGLLIEPGNPYDLAEKLAVILGEPELARRMGLEGRILVASVYSTESWVNSYRRMLDALT